MTKDINLVIADSIEIVANFSIPLYVIENKRPVLIGSGFFVEVREKIALISAAHVLNQISKENPLFAYRKPDEIIQITGKRFLSDPETVDLGFILVNDVGLPWREVRKVACKLEYLHPQRVPREKRRYAIPGFPETKNRVNPSNKTIKAALHAYHAYSIPDSKYAEAGLDPSLHVALPLDLKKGFDPDGNHVNFPKPNGMSGSPIWEITDESGDPNQPRVFPIVAVATTYKNKVVYGTDIGKLLPVLLDAA